MTNKRKGARTLKDIQPEVLAALNAGQMQTANLVEWLAIDQVVLLETILTAAVRQAYFPAVKAALVALEKPTITLRNKTIGSVLLQQALAEGDEDFLYFMRTHPADAVRCWATYTVGEYPNLSLTELLEGIKPFAADEHFGVRETAWMAIRHHIIADLEEALALLLPWTLEEDENIRRFATEATRPRGVWCAHIEVLKVQPALGLPLLERLKDDPARYVQDSVANWLNDAAKTCPAFVLEVCEAWSVGTVSKSRAYILKRAVRSLK